MRHHFPSETESGSHVAVNFESDPSILSDAYTIIHCRYRAKEKYVNGGWVNIWSSTFLTNGQGESIKMIHAENVPIAPEKHFFTRAGQVLLFTLFYPSLPSSWSHFDLIEKTDTGNGFTVKRITRNKTGVYRVNVF